MDSVKRRSRTSLVAMVAVLALVLGGCTSVSRTALTSSSKGRGPESAVGVDGTPSDESVLAGGPDGTAAAGVSTSTPSRRPGQALASGSSACRQPVSVGVSYTSDLAAAFAAAGDPTKAGQFSNYVAQVQEQDQRAADYVNAHGGLAGCEVQLVFHDFHLTASDGFSAESQRECVDFSQDHRVFVAIPTSAENQTYVTCMAKNNVINVYQPNQYYPTPHDFEQYAGLLYATTYITPYRWKPFIGLLKQYGYFDAGAKVGILLADDGSGTNQHLVNDLWKPALAALGITPEVFTFTQFQAVSGASETTSQFSSAVLQFKAAGVNRVMFTPDGGQGPQFFTRAASSQNFRPRYALSTINYPTGWGSNASDQLPGAVAVSYTVNDLGAAPSSYFDQQMATNPPNSTRVACDQIYKGRTGSTPVTNFYQFCDSLLFLQAALKGATAVTKASLLAGANALANSHPLAGGYGPASFRPPNHYDASAAVRVMTWDESANGWKYASPPVAIP